MDELKYFIDSLVEILIKEAIENEARSTKGVSRKFSK